MNLYYSQLRHIGATLTISILLVLASDHQINAQSEVSGALEGQVVDKVTHEPIPGIRIKIINERFRLVRTIMTDQYGRFYQGLLQPDIYLIQFSKSGYLARDIRQAVFTNRTNQVFPLVELEPLEPDVRIQQGPPVTGSLAVASISNAVIVIEPLDGGRGYKDVIPTDQLLSVFENLPPKSYRVIASLQGYQPAKKEVVVLANRTAGLTLNLMPTESSAQIIAQAGRYYALIIGNNKYQYIPNLKTAAADAVAVNSILREKYGFETKLLLDATREQIIVALNEYRRTIEPNANLLIYYAGHGFNDKEVEKAYWLPVNARKQNNANWISADDITSNIKGIPAKHILIVSDSCYSGVISRSTVDDISEPRGREKYLQKLMSGKSRSLLASGGNEPVADSGGGVHSVFAGALLTGLLRMKKDIYAAEELYRDYIREAVTGNSNQTPEYNPLRNSGHESGDFVFIRKRQ